MADIGGSPWVLLLVDGDYDGRYDSKKDLWYVGEASNFKGASYANMFEGSEPARTIRAGAWDAYRLVSVDEKGVATVAVEPAPGPLSEYLERRAERVNEGHWFPNFRGEQDAFMAAQGIDPKRPKVTAPSPFHYAADFEEARERATKEGKPLLVDFEADWCVWCKRIDFYSYPDAAVSARLAKFTCVKMSTDFDPKKTLSRLQETYGPSWGGLPAVGVFHADGVPVAFSYARTGKKPATADHIAGFLTPVELVDALDAALAAWKAGARATPAPKAPPKPTGPAPHEPPPAGAPPEPAMGAGSAK
jgi:hypothetical protein